MKKTAAVMAALILIFSALFGGTVTTSAEEAGERAFDSSPVLADLTGAETTTGETFDLTDYPYNENGKAQLVSLVEYAYSYAANMRGSYALYLYIYNPTGAAIATGTGMNAAQLAVSYGADGEPDGYDKFDLIFCNRSGGDYNNLFYKFRVEDHESADGKTIAERVNSNARRYDLSGVELAAEGVSNPTEYSDSVAGTYIYSGYASGCGPDATAASTLTCEAEPLDVIAVEDVRSTYYNFPRTMTKDTQLNSVYFALDADYEFLDGTDELYGIEAEYWKYLTAPMFVTDSTSFYDSQKSWVGVNIGSGGDAANEWAAYSWEYSLHPALVAGLTVAGGLPGGILSQIFRDAGTVYNAASLPWNISDTEESNYITKMVYLFSTYGTDVSDYVLPREEIMQYWADYTEAHGAGSIRGGYNDDLFVPYDEDGDGRTDDPYNRIYTTVDDVIDIPGFNADDWLQGWFLNLFGSTFDGISGIVPIVEVTAEDIANEKAIPSELYVAADDVEEFTDFCRSRFAQGKRVYLFRYDVSEYTAEDIVVDRHGVTPADSSSTELRQEFVSLGFDMISFTFKDAAGALTVIPAAMSPIDVIPDGTPSRQPSARDAADLIRKIVIIVIIAAVVALVIFIAVKLIGKSLSRPKVSVNVSGGSTAAAKPAAKKKSASSRKRTAKKKKPKTTVSKSKGG